MRISLSLALLLSLAAGCGGTSSAADVGPDGPPIADVGTDAVVASDTGTDAPALADAGSDAASTDDAGSDLAQVCRDHFGTVGMQLCCGATNDFPNTCAVGACGCAPSSSHQIEVCNCPGSSCFDGTACVPTR